MKAAVLLLAVPLTLAACSGEPSEGDMRTLVEAHIKRTFGSFRKQGCVAAKDRSDAYDCYYQATVPPTAAGGRAVTVNGKGRFAPGDRGLVFVDLGAQPR